MKRAHFLFWLLAGLAGCAHAPSLQPALPPQAGNPQLLYLQPAPHRSLYVEMDAVKGAEPSEAELRMLKTALQEWCDKPDGITIARSSVIAPSAARGKSALALARQYLDGPPKTTNAPPPAFLYVLFYDNRINRNPLQSPRAASQGPTREVLSLELGRSQNPHVILFPYLAMIYVDRSWLAGLGLDKYRRVSLTHEMGHVLGLVRRPSRILGSHCPTGGCVMSSVSKNFSSDVGNWLKGRRSKPGFCDACRAELGQFQSATNQTTMCFVGPVLVRTEPGYQVLSLPGACRLYIGEALDTEIGQFLASWHQRDPEETWWMSGNVDTEEGRALQAIVAAEQDPEEPVRKAAVKLEAALRKQIDQRVRGEAVAPDK